MLMISNAANTNTIANWIQMGANTQRHLQSIMPVSFSTIKTMVRSPVKDTPPLTYLLLSFIIILPFHFHLFVQIRHHATHLDNVLAAIPEWASGASVRPQQLAEELCHRLVIHITYYFNPLHPFHRFLKNVSL